MRLRQLTPAPQLSIITYHHVAAPDPAYPYDPQVADATPTQFRRQIEMLARYGTPIGVDDLLRAIGGAPLPKNPVMITFDDGYRSCHDVALPILRAVGVRATFFIATSFITERRLYWWERIALIIAHAPRRRGMLSYPHTIELDLDQREIGDVLTDVVKNTRGLDLERFLDELNQTFELPWTRQLEAGYADQLIMTWDQVRALARAGMDVESHGRHHRVLQTLEDAELQDDLTGSRLELEAQLGRPVRAVAYPVGRRINSEQRIRTALAKAGYQIGLSNHSGVNRWWPPALRQIAPIDPFDVRRLAIDREMSDAMFLMQIAVPQLGYASGNGH
ncbi:MAG: polysaccharide deacetylase family protein [Myxococcales bacterium]|nr:polysaccharide deacetylase family protein [Myxococcales bacterium]